MTKANTSTLLKQCQFGRHVKVIERIQAYPEEAKIQDSEGDTPLHMLMMGNPPLYVTKALYEVYPQAALTKNKLDRTPLHYAALRASKEVVRFFIQVSPLAFNIKDDGGEIPLFWACLNKRKEVTKIILDSFPRGVFEKNVDGIDPLTCLTQSVCTKQILRDTNLIATFQKNPSITLQSRFALEDHPLDSFWDKICYLLKAKYTLSNDDAGLKKKEWRLLHACLSMECPWEIYMLALRLNARHLKDADDDGSNPLHIAAANLSMNQLTMRKRRHLISFLIMHHPRAARIVDHEGRLPLHIGLNCGKTWEFTSPIFRAEPRAVSARDPKSHLFPFMIAAITHKPMSNDEEVAHHNDIQLIDMQLTTIYLVLREDPTTCRVL